MTLLGAILMLAALAFFGFITWVVLKRPATTSLSTEDDVNTLPTDKLVGASKKKKLKVTQSGQFVQLLGEASERKVQAALTLYELFKRRESAPWERTGAVSKALLLSGGVWIFKVPQKEGGKPKWYKAHEIDTFQLTSFYIDGDSTGDSGPARRFRKNKQTTPVPYKLPNNITPNITWEVIDIGAFEAQVDGECEQVFTSDRLYFVTSREQGGDGALLYLDARKGEAKGSGGLFHCEPFEPSVDVTDIL